MGRAMNEFRDDVVEATRMKRRSFLALLGMSGVAAALPIEVLIPEAAAAEAVADPEVIEPGDMWIMDFRSGEKVKVKLGQLRNVMSSVNSGHELIETIGGRMPMMGMREPETLSVEVSNVVVKGMNSLMGAFHDRQRVTVGVHAFGHLRDLTIPGVLIKETETSFEQGSMGCSIEFIAIDRRKWTFS